MRKKIIGVMGPGAGATDTDKKNAFELGKKIAENGWILLSGGRNVGVMDAVSKGAHEAGGMVVGILPSKSGEDASEGVDVKIITGMGGGRNVINVLSSDVVVACGMGSGTSSEVGLSIKAGRPTILLNNGSKAEAFFTELAKDLVHTSSSVEETIKLIQQLLS